MGEEGDGVGGKGAVCGMAEDIICAIRYTTYREYANISVHTRITRTQSALLDQIYASHFFFVMI